MCIVVICNYKFSPVYEWGVIMGFEVQESNVNYVKLDDLEKGSVLIATYTGSITGGDYNTTTYFFQEADGSKTGINGCADLDRKMALVEEGAKLKVYYNGKTKIETSHGIVKAHTFWIEELAEDNSVIRALIPPKKNAAATATSTNTADDGSLREINGAV